MSTLPRQDVQPRDLAAILDFMYHGEVNVKQDHLNSFLAVAKRLKVRGLCEDLHSSSTSQTEKQKFTHSPDLAQQEPKPKRSRPDPVTHEEDEVQELAPLEVKLELDGGTNSVAHSIVADQQQHEHYPMVQEGYDDGLQESEYGDTSGYEDGTGYMEVHGGGPTQGSKGGRS